MPDPEGYVQLQLPTAQIRQQPAEVSSSTTGAVATPASDAVRAVRTLQLLSTDAQELLRVIAANRHLTVSEHDALENSPPAAALAELERTGVIVALRPAGRAPEAVYWLPPQGATVLTSAVRLLPRAPMDVRRFVRDVLAENGYKYPSRPPRVDDSDID